MMMKRKRSSSREAMERTELSSEATRLLKEFQYLVILNILSSRTHLNTEIPSGDMIFVSTKIVSRIPPQTMKQSKRLKRDTK